MKTISSRRRSLAIESLEARLNLSTLGGVSALTPAHISGRTPNTAQRIPLKVKSVSALAATSTLPDMTSTFGDTTLSASGATAVPVTDYAAISNAQIEYASGIPDVGYMKTSGVSIDYKVNAQTAGNYNLAFNVSSYSAGTFDVYVNGKWAVSYSFNGTGGWYNWKQTTQQIALSAGSNTIHILPTWGSVFNIGGITLSPQNPTSTGTSTATATTTTTNTTSTSSSNVASVGSSSVTIQPQNYSTIYNCQLEYLNGKPDIGWVSTSGAYVEYQLNVQQAGMYNVQVSAASLNWASFQVLVNGQSMANYTSQTGSWSNFQPVTNSIWLPVGNVTLRFNALGGTQYNIGGVTISPSNGNTTTSTTTTSTTTNNPPPSTTSSNPVSISSSWLTSFNQLNVIGTSGNDTINVTQSGDTLTISANGQTSTYSASSYGDLVILGGDGNDTINVDSSVRLNTRIYGQGGNDILTDKTQGKGIIVAVGGGYDVLTGGGNNTSYWADNSDSVNASSGEWGNNHVHVISGFWGGAPLDLTGQNLADPSGTGATTRLTNSSFWGTGPTMNDVVQGQVSDCYFVGALQTLAYSAPDKLRELGVDLGDGTYAIQFNRGGTTSYVRVDGDLPANGPYANGLMYAHPGSSGNMWLPIFEKAYAEFRSGAWSYSSLTFGNFNQVLADFGQNTSGISNGDPNTMFNQIQNAVNSGHGVTVGTYTSGGVQAGAPLIGDHTYTVTAAWKDAWGNSYLTLRNPWGYDGAGSDSNTSDGLVTLTAAQMQANLQAGSILL